MFSRKKKSGRYEYLQLVENRRENGRTVQRVVATIGRIDKLKEKGRLEKVIASMTRFCENAMLLVSTNAEDCGIKSRVLKIGPSLIFERLWIKTGIKDVIKELLRDRKYQFDVERAIYLTILNRVFAPGSDRSCNEWRERYKIEGIDGVSLHHLYRAMAWLGEELPNNQQEGVTPFSPRCIKDVIEEKLFERRRDLFSELEVVFFDTTSLYFEGCGGQTLGQNGRSKDHRPECPQMVLGIVLDGEGKPICCELWPGNTADVKTLIPIAERLRKRFGINRVCIVADRGMISRDTIERLESRDYKMDYILGVRMRNQKEVKEDVLNNSDEFEEIFPGKCKAKDPSPLKVKEVCVGDNRYIVCYNEEQARKDVHTREVIVEALRDKIKTKAKSLIGNKGYRKYLTIDKNSFELDAAKIESDARYDGLWVLKTNMKLTSKEAALKYKQLWMVEKTFRDCKSLLKTRPIFHKYDETIRGHVFCSFLALVVKNYLERELENAGYSFEWAQIKRDLKALEETEISHEGKDFLVRSECQGICGKIFQTVGVAIPSAIRRK